MSPDDVMGCPASCSRRGFRVRGLKLSLAAESEGDGAPSDAAVRKAHLLAKVWRLSARRAASVRRRAALSPGASTCPPLLRASSPHRVVALRSFGRRNLPASASSSQAARSGQPGGAPTPPEYLLARQIRGRRPDPHDRRNRFASPHGSGAASVRAD